MTKPRIAIHNIHRLPNITNWKIHNYALELVRQGHIDYLYFDDATPLKNLRFNLGRINQIKKMYSKEELGLDKTRFLFGERALQKNCDILLNFNSVDPNDFTPALKKFSGLKIFHVMDYFWRGPATKKNALLKEYDVSYLMSYSSSDKHCEYFKSSFPDYVGYVMPVPFGYTGRFVDTKPFSKRTPKCIALGSVNPLRPPDAAPINYQESADFHKGERWFHKFRRMLVEKHDSLTLVMDSLLPVFPKYKDSSYDIVATLNSYQMFTSDESIFFFPSAKTYEGVAAGSVLVCSDHPCFTEFGFKDGVNCITHKEFDVADFEERIKYWQARPQELARIQENSKKLVESNYTHKAVASGIMCGVTYLHDRVSASGQRVSIAEHSFWPLVT